MSERQIAFIAFLCVVTLIICYSVYLFNPPNIEPMTEADIEVERWCDWFGRSLTPCEERRLRELIAKRERAKATHQREPSRENFKAWKEVHADMLYFENEIAVSSANGL